MSSHSMLLSMALKATCRWNGIEVVGFRVLFSNVHTQQAIKKTKKMTEIGNESTTVGSPESPKSPCSSEFE